MFAIRIALFSVLWLTTGAETLVVFAQGDVARSTVKGKVTDQSGASVIGAKVTALNAEHGVVRKVTTNNEGAYHCPLLQPGLYDLRVEAGVPNPALAESIADGWASRGP